MELKSRLVRQLESGRQFSEQLLEKFKTPEQWVHQTHAKANHALWFAGHMGLTDNFFISTYDKSQGEEPEGFSQAFGMGSQPTSDPSSYPAVEEVLGYMRGRRAVLMDILHGMTDDDLAKSTPEGTPDMWPDFASLVELVIWHEGLHSGQVTVASRSLGNPCVMGGGE